MVTKQILTLKIQLCVNMCSHHICPDSTGIQQHIIQYLWQHTTASVHNYMVTVLVTRSINVFGISSSPMFQKIFWIWLSHWETTLQCNIASHWLSPYPEWFLMFRWRSSRNWNSSCFLVWVNVPISLGALAHSTCSRSAKIFWTVCKIQSRPFCQGASELPAQPDNSGMEWSRIPLMSHITSHRKTSSTLEGARSVFGVFQLLWNLADVSLTQLQVYLSNFKAYTCISTHNLVGSRLCQILPQREAIIALVAWRQTGDTRLSKPMVTQFSDACMRH